MEEKRKWGKKKKRSGVRVIAPSCSHDCFLAVLLCMEVNGVKVKHSSVEVHGGSHHTSSSRQQRNVSFVSQASVIIATTD